MTSCNCNNYSVDKPKLKDQSVSKWPHLTALEREGGAAGRVSIIHINSVILFLL